MGEVAGQISVKAEVILWFAPARAPIAPDLVRESVRLNYAIDVAVAALGSEAVQTFRLTGTDGTLFLAKFMPDQDIAKAGFQAHAMQHLSRVTPDLPVARPVIARNGDVVCRASGVPGYGMMLASWQAGEPLSGFPAIAGMPGIMGRMLGRLDHGLATFTWADTDHASVWDLAIAPAHGRRLAAITDAGERRLVEEALAAAPAVAGFRRQVIHGDFSPSNVAVQPHDRTRISGVFDFGDCIESALIHDVAIACALQVSGDDDPLRGPVDFVTAYVQEMPLTEMELAALFGLMRLRLAALLLVNRSHAAERPDAAAHILKNVPRASKNLARLAGIDDDDAAARFIRAGEYRD